jgi:hypothetical protein
MVMREAPYPAEQVLACTIDIEALRQYRMRTNHNCWVDVRTEGFRQIYNKPIYPPNRFPSGKPPRTLSDKITLCKEVFDDLYARGQFTPPAGIGRCVEILQNGSITRRTPAGWVELRRKQTTATAPAMGTLNMISNMNKFRFVVLFALVFSSACGAGETWFTSTAKVDPHEYLSKMRHRDSFDFRGKCALRQLALSPNGTLFVISA